MLSNGVDRRADPQETENQMKDSTKDQVQGKVQSWSPAMQKAAEGLVPFWVVDSAPHPLSLY